MIADSNETIVGRQKLSRMGLERSLLACQEELGAMRVRAATAENSLEDARARIAALEAMYESSDRFAALNHERAERAEDALGRLAEKHNDLLARVASIWVKRPDPTGNSGTDREAIIGVTVERCQQTKGPDLWAVRCGGNVLSRSGEWELEPMPSSRDADFIDRCRFADLGYALAIGRMARGADES